MDNLTLTPVARIQNDFTSKFGLPRQSGIIRTLESTVVFEPAFRNPDTLRGLSGFSHLWLIWGFSENLRSEWSPTVRPPRLGGNTRMGVFATRSPFRPNPLGLSCVELKAIHLETPSSPTLTVFGADLMNGTPIYDIKPYLPYTDSIPGRAWRLCPRSAGSGASGELPGRAFCSAFRRRSGKRFFPCWKATRAPLIRKTRSACTASGLLGWIFGFRSRTAF